MRAQPLLGAAGPPAGCCGSATVAATKADNSTKARIALAADLTLNWRRKVISKNKIDQGLISDVNTEIG